MNNDETTRLTRLMDWCSECWEKVGEFFRRKPVMVVFMFVAAIVVTFMVTYSAVVATQNKQSIQDVTSAFCNGQAAPEDMRNQARCQALLDRLLYDPTPEQKERLRRLMLDAERSP